MIAPTPSRAIDPLIHSPLQGHAQTAFGAVSAQALAIFAQVEELGDTARAGEKVGVCPSKNGGFTKKHKGCVQEKCWLNKWKGWYNW